VDYARDRGIRVVPEFDMPAHSRSWFVGYPELASTPGTYKIEPGGVYTVIDPTQDRTYKFLDKFIAEMAKLFPDAYFHIGGDEVNGKPWDDNPKIQAFIHSHGMKSNQDLQAYFNQRLQKILSKHHKIMVDGMKSFGLICRRVLSCSRGEARNRWLPRRSKVTVACSPSDTTSI
jgi:hexosaminidase